MGNSPRIVFQHYRELVRPAEAAKYWALAPVKRGEVVPVPAM